MPPPEFFRIAGLVTGKIDGTTEHVQKTAVNVLALHLTKAIIHSLGVGTVQIGHTLVPKLDQVLLNAFTNAGDGAEVCFGVIIIHVVMPNPKDVPLEFSKPDPIQ